MEKIKYAIDFDEIKKMFNMSDEDIILEVKQNHEREAIEILVLSK